VPVPPPRPSGRASSIIYATPWGAWPRWPGPGTTTLKDFYELWPERFSNKTNGVTPRRFLALSNPGLRALLDRAVGDGWLTDLGRLRGLEPHAEDGEFRREWRTVKEANKQRLAFYIQSHTGIALDPTWLFDIQVKRIHEYKRQHLNLLHIVTLYRRLKENPALAIPPRAFIFGGKAAPGYFMAKRIIKLINAVAETVNADPEVNTRLRVAFVPNFNVQNAHLIYPAADLSEQISTAGKEASGTGNMKFMLNGAVTIGTLDGANVEMREEAGAENFFLFGLNAEELERVKREGYRPADQVAANAELRAVLELVGSGHFTHNDSEVPRPLVENLTQSDNHLADPARGPTVQVGISPEPETRREESTMKLYGGIDLHSNNSVVALFLNANPKGPKFR
jgi:glycogen phosphorylase